MDIFEIWFLNRSARIMRLIGLNAGRNPSIGICVRMPGAIGVPESLPFSSSQPQ
jgi:hypothetical protein